MKIIGIITDDCITGVQYGVIEIEDAQQPQGDIYKNAQKALNKASKYQQKIKFARNYKNNTRKK